jgi:hypothetical protein
MARDFFGVPRELLPLLFHHLVGKHRVRNGDDIARGKRVVEHLFAHADDFLHDERGAEKRF